MTAQDILKMIQAVDPNQPEKLDQIDCEVEAFIRDTGTHYADGYWWVYSDRGDNPESYTPKQYTRSRDALKAIRPKRWMFCIEELAEGAWTSTLEYDIASGWVSFYSQPLPTEELAELRAIIQAIAHERGER